MTDLLCNTVKQLYSQRKETIDRSWTDLYILGKGNQVFFTFRPEPRIPKQVLKDDS